MRKVAIAALVAVLTFAAPFGAFAQTSSGTTAVPAQAGGPAAVGQAMAQVDQGGHVAIVGVPAPAPQQGSGVITVGQAFGWLQPYVDAVVQMALLALLGIFGKSKYGQMMDQSSRDALTAFVTNRASSLIADGAVSISGKAIKVNDPHLLAAANEASTAIPDALKRFGLTPDVVAQKIIDAIPQTQAGAQMISAAHATDPANPPVPVDRPPAVATPATT